MLCVILVGVSALTARAHDDIDTHRECSQCGMDRKVYGYSRMLIVYENGLQVGVCSVHCAATELNRHGGNKVKTILVADRDTHMLINAETAYWVIGGKKRGVMTQQPKWAFATNAAARAFITAHGGTITNWETALSAARKE
jgi:NosL.